MALSMPKALGFSPGARKAPGSTVFTGTMFWRELKLGVAYMIEVTEPKGSTANAVDRGLVGAAMDDREQLAFPGGAERDGLARRRPAAESGESLRPGDRELDGRSSILAAMAATAP